MALECCFQMAHSLSTVDTFIFMRIWFIISISPESQDRLYSFTPCLDCLHSLSTTTMSSQRDTIVVPEQMTVGELRSWLSQFGDKNREHYEKNKITKRAASTDFQKRIQQMEQILSSTSSESSSRESLDDPRPSYRPVRNLYDRRLDSKSTDIGVDKEEGLSLQPDAIPEDPSTSEDSFFAKLLEKEEGTAATQPSFEDLHSSPERHLGLEDDSAMRDEDYKIESIHKLLEAPKPVHRHKSTGSWEVFFDDEFADPTASTGSQTSIVWQQEGQTLSSHLGGQDHIDERAHGVASDDESAASSIFNDLRRNQLKTIDNRTDDSISIKSRTSTLSKSSRGSIRKRLPLLLCKTVKDDPPKLIQRTFSNAWPDIESSSLYVREHSPYPRNLSTGHTKGRPTVIVEPSPVVDSLTDVIAPRRVRNVENASTASCPDFAAATAFLQKYSNNHDARGASAIRGRERHTTRATTKQSEAMYGTSAILPGAIDFSMGQAFDFDAPSSGFQQEFDYKPPRTESGNGSDNRNNINVKDHVTKFGGAGSRRRSAVQQRQEELKKHWSATRSVQHTKTVKWQVCAKTGNYKKKIVVEQVDE